MSPPQKTYQTPSVPSWLRGWSQALRVRLV